MARSNFAFPLLLLLLLLLSSCVESSTPTATLAPPPTVTAGAGQATAVLDATQTGAPPTETVETPPAAASATPDVATPTLAVGDTPTVAATSEPEATTPAASFTVVEPAPNAQWGTASTVSLSGRAPAGVETVTATLRAAGLDLASAQAAPSDGGDWQMTMELPATLTGAATLHFAVDGEPAEEILVELALPGATSGPALTLSHPQFDSAVVSGQVLFFTGSFQQPAGESLTIAVLYEDCQTTASMTSFEVGEGGRWWGYIVVPETVYGPACAIAYLGEFDGDEWRAAHAPINILESDDPQARGLFIGNFAGSELTPGESVTVFGSAYNAPNRQVRVALQVAGETVAQGTTGADTFGYWEINLVLPASAASAAEGQFNASVTYEDEEVEETVPFTIAP